MSRLMNDVSALQHVLTDAPIDSAKQVVTLVGGITILLLMNWRLCLLILVLLPAIVLVARFFGRRLKTLSTGIQDETAGASTILEEVLSGIRVVKSFVQERYEQARFAAQDPLCSRSGGQCNQQRRRTYQLLGIPEQSEARDQV